MTCNPAWRRAALLGCLAALSAAGCRGAERPAEEGTAAPGAAGSAGAGATGAAGSAAVAGSGAAGAGEQRAPGGFVVPPGGLREWVAEIRAGVRELPARAVRDAAEAQRQALDLYVGRQEFIELFYGPSGRLRPGAALATAVQEAETRFHELLQLLGATPPPDSARVAAAVAALDAQLESVLAEAERSGVPLTPRGGEAAAPSDDEGAATPAAARSGALPPPGARRAARTEEVGSLLRELEAAAAAYRQGDAAGALDRVGRAYLEGFEPLESRLPAGLAADIERRFHLELRPLLARSAPARNVEQAFAGLRSQLLAADAVLGGPATFWFGAANSFLIIVREGLEAVLLIAALLAFLRATGAAACHARGVYAGAALGAAASGATWLVARTILPIDGGSRELLEGITALAAVAVLLYVSHWLFQKTYIHDWKNFLRDQADRAVSAGSALALTGLAFAAVYREGFETVLFYQALLFDTGPAAVLGGFVPGAVAVLALALAIVRLGVRLPLGKVFAATNAVLLYLAFTFLGKGLYNLQEAGLFTPRPVPGVPDHPALKLALGVYPVAQTLLAQAALLLLLATTYAYYRRARAARRPAPAPASPPARPKRRPGTAARV